MPEALPTDNAGGWNSPSAIGPTEGMGGAFILPGSKAADRGVADLKEVMRQRAAEKIKQQNALLKMGDVPLKNALPEHITNYILPAKKEFHDKMTNIYRKSASDPNYFNTEEGRKNLLEASKAKDELEGMVMAASNVATLHDANVKKLNEDHEGYYDSGTAHEQMAKIGQVSPFEASQIVQSTLTPNMGRLRTKAQKGFVDVLGKDVVEFSKNGREIKQQNLFVDPATGKESEFYQTRFLPAAKEYVKNNPELIADRIKKDKLVDDVNSTAEEKAAAIEIEALKPLIEQQYVNKLQFKPDQPTEGDKKRMSMVGEVTPNVDIQTEGGASSITAHKKLQARIEKPVQISHVAGKVFDTGTRAPIHDLPTDFKIDPSDVIDMTVKKKDGGGTEVRRMILGTATYYDKKQYEKTRETIFKENLANEQRKWIEANPNKKPTVNQYAKITQDAEPSEDDVISAMPERAVKTKDVMVPYEENKHIYGENASVIDKKMGEIPSSPKSAPVQKLSGKVNPAQLKKGSVYEVNGKNYLWNGTNLIEK